MMFQWSTDCLLVDEQENVKRRKPHKKQSLQNLQFWNRLPPGEGNFYQSIRSKPLPLTFNATLAKFNMNHQLENLRAKENLTFDLNYRHMKRNLKKCLWVPFLFHGGINQNTRGDNLKLWSNFEHSFVFKNQKIEMTVQMQSTLLLIHMYCTRGFELFLFFF